MNNVQAPLGAGRAQRPGSAAAARSRGTKTAEPQTITRWSVVGNGRLFGRIHHRPGTPDGNIIITSPVVQVRFVGVDGTPLAFTESGNAYWLGTPAENFGVARAQEFVWHKARIGEAPARAPQPEQATTLIRLMD